MSCPRQSCEYENQLVLFCANAPTKCVLWYDPNFELNILDMSFEKHIKHLKMQNNTLGAVEFGGRKHLK